ncbi:MAG: RsmB/NOP family class I SAM-dependent RNA methyltransferase [Clostridia bacterium]|nr:RsmB/NOP family class I SAM-dependent RNA methyltransferase [Clostridia bacterium]
MDRLPRAFIERMKKQLPESEREAFFAVYGKKPFKGVRLNPLKGEVEKIASLLPFLSKRVPWEENGYYTDLEKVGASPFHHAGLFYSQEPSATCAAPLLEVQKGERVLDLCAAPGGKSTQLAAAMRGEGILVVNEPFSARAKILSQNIERMGVKNAVVACETPEKLSARFAAYFDKILIDAPCSGEGMFRKNAEEALGEWSEENVALCAQRQKRILDEGTKMLAAGGRLVYSTCTFSEEEDEGQVRDYLASHPEMRLIKTEKLYPHKVEGEGHFAALFEKLEGERRRDLRLVKPRVSQASERAYREFERALFHAPLARNLHEVNGVLYELPQGVFEWQGLQVLRVGLRLGEAKGGRFEPSHALCMSVRKADCKRAVELERDDPRVEKYLRGETVQAEIANGWCLVCVSGYPLGWGKAVGGVVKNHLPKGLRRL